MLGEKLPSDFKWISSTQSPLMLLPRALARAWDGAAGGNFAVLDDLCEPLVCIPVSHGHALVLEDGFHTSWWPEPLTGGGMLVRTLWASSAQTVRAAVQTIDEDAWMPEPFHFDSCDGAVGLFPAVDAAMAASDVLSFHVAPGKHVVLSANVEPDPSTCLIVHRLLPLH
ncbi:MAG: Imm21 family immunity protein [bacterium]